MNHEVYLLPMTEEMYHEYFKEYENDPDLSMDPEDYVPYVYDKEKVDRYIEKQKVPDRRAFAIMVGVEQVGELILKNIVERRSATLS